MCVCYTDRICVRKRLSFGADFVASEFPAPAWRNWQTRWTQNPVIARSCGFEPLRRHARLQFQRDASAALENNVFTDSRDSTMIVNTPRIVPNGTKMHSTHATTNANQ